MARSNPGRFRKECLSRAAKNGWLFVSKITRRLTGVLDLTFPPEEEHPLMPFYMKEAARRIQEILAEWASLRQRAQFECFVNLGKRGQRAEWSRDRWQLYH